MVGGPVFSWRFWPYFRLALTPAPVRVTMIPIGGVSQPWLPLLMAFSSASFRSAALWAFDFHHPWCTCALILNGSSRPVWNGRRKSPEKVGHSRSLLCVAWVSSARLGVVPRGCPDSSRFLRWCESRHLLCSQRPSGLRRFRAAPIWMPYQLSPKFGDSDIVARVQA
jgi:hypothetical protein